MTATDVTSVTARQLLPNCDLSMDILTYSKAAAADYLTWTTNTIIQNVRFALARDDSAGAEDPLTYSNTTKVITLSAGTGAGRILIIGNC